MEGEVVFLKQGSGASIVFVGDWVLQGLSTMLSIGCVQESKGAFQLRNSAPQSVPKQHRFFSSSVLRLLLPLLP